MLQPQFFTVFCFSFFLSLSQAFSAGLVSTVSSPDVAENILNAGLRFGYDLGETDGRNNDNLIVRQQFEYGFSDIYSARLQFIQNKRQYGSWQQNAVGFQNRIEFADEKKDGWGASVRASYQYRSGRDRHDTLRTSYLYLLPDVMGAEFRQNILLEYNVDKDFSKGLEAEFRTQMTFALSEQTDIGIEMMNIFPSFFNQNIGQGDIHQIGPILKTKLTDQVSLQTGYRLTTDGQTDSHGFMLYFGRKFIIE